MSAIDTIASSIAHHVRQHHPPHHRPAVRDAHPKHHGCVRARLVVEPADRLPEQLRRGIFAHPGRTYPAWVRFSNALKDRHDLAPDARGMTVKLMDIDQSDSGTQDLLMVSHDVFFARDADEFLDFPATVSEDTFKMRTWLRVAGFFVGLRPLRFRLRGMVALARSLKPAWNPLAMEYFSQTPYRLGADRLMKYGVRPHEARPLWRRVLIRLRALSHAVLSSVIPMESTRNMLRTALLERLRSGGAAFDLRVQVREAPADRAARDRIEDDALTSWSTRAYPPRTVAVLHIDALPPGFDEETMLAFAEHLSFTPWHHVPEHEPVGTINLARRIVYERISSLRHELNGVRRREPDAGETPAEYLAAIGARVGTAASRPGHAAEPLTPARTA
jgi:hypothetical protein